MQEYKLPQPLSSPLRQFSWMHLPWFLTVCESDIPPACSNFLPFPKIVLVHVAVAAEIFPNCRSSKKKKEIKIKFGIPKYIHFVFSSCNKPPWFFHVSFWPALGQTRISPKRFECWDRAMDPFPRTVLLRRILVRRPPLNSVPSLVRNWCNRSTA